MRQIHVMFALPSVCGGGGGVIRKQKRDPIGSLAGSSTLKAHRGETRLSLETGVKEMKEPGVLQKCAPNSVTISSSAL